MFANSITAIVAKEMIFGMDSMTLSMIALTVIFSYISSEEYNGFTI